MDDGLTGERLRRLRVSLGYTQRELSEATAVAAKEMGGAPYRRVSSNMLSNIEHGLAGLMKDAPRAVLCRVVKVSRDEFADYLEGKLSLEGLHAARLLRGGELVMPAMRRTRRGLAAPAAPSSM